MIECELEEFFISSVEWDKITELYHVLKVKFF